MACPGQTKAHENALKSRSFRVFLLVPMKNQARAAEGRRKMRPAEGAPKTAPSFLRLFRRFS